MTDDPTVFLTNEGDEADKYVVIKREVWEAIKRGEHDADIDDCCGMEGILQDIENLGLIHDAVVIRLQDVFAGPALHAYSSAIAIVVRTLKFTHAATIDPLVYDAIERLAKIADHFHDKAVLADQYAASNAAKLPD